jgi:hypothetical protein
VKALNFALFSCAYESGDRRVYFARQGWVAAGRKWGVQAEVPAN